MLIIRDNRKYVYLQMCLCQKMKPKNIKLSANKCKRMWKSER